MDSEEEAGVHENQRWDEEERVRYCTASGTAVRSVEGASFKKLARSPSARVPRARRAKCKDKDETSSILPSLQNKRTNCLARPELIRRLLLLSS